MDKIYESFGVLAKTNPALVNNNTVTTGWGDHSKYEKSLWIVNLGATDTTIQNIKVQQATDSNGSNPKDVTGKSFTNLTATDDNKILLLYLDVADLDQTSGTTPYNYVNMTATIGSGSTGAVVDIIALGYAHVLPATDVVTVAQKVA